MNGIIKTLLIIVLVLLSAIVGTGANTHYPIVLAILPPFLFGLTLTLVIAFISSFFKNVAIVKPQWNDTILSFRKPLSIIQFFGFLFVLISIEKQFQQWFRNNDFDQFGVLIGTLGVSLLVGVWVTVRIEKWVT